MQSNRKKVIYASLTILLSMTSNMYTVPIHAMEESPQEVVYEDLGGNYSIQLNGMENDQVRQIVIGKLAEFDYLNTVGEVRVIAQDSDSEYYVVGNRLVKSDLATKGIGNQTISVRYADINELELVTIDSIFNMVNLDQEMVIGIYKEDNEAPTIKLKKNEIKITTNDTFNAQKYLSSVEDNLDPYLDVIIQEDIDTKVPGIYEVNYTATDSSGNTTSEMLTVAVRKGVDYNAIAEAAKAQIGVAQDCTMLVTNSLKAVGIKFHGAPYEYTSLGSFTKNPVPGDICIYQGHVAIYIGNGKAIHGGYDGMTVKSTVGCSNAFIGYIHIKDNK